MTERSDDAQPVTRGEFNAALAKLPTRWEVRFLVVAGMVAINQIPTSGVASAAVKAMFQ